MPSGPTELERSRAPAKAGANLAGGGGDDFCTKEDLKTARYWPNAFQASEAYYGKLPDGDKRKFDASDWALAQCSVSKLQFLPRNKLQEVILKARDFAMVQKAMSDASQGIGDDPPTDDGMGDDDVPF